MTFTYWLIAFVLLAQTVQVAMKSICLLANAHKKSLERLFIYTLTRSVAVLCAVSRLERRKKNKFLMSFARNVLLFWGLLKQNYIIYWLLFLFAASGVLLFFHLTKHASIMLPDKANTWLLCCWVNVTHGCFGFKYLFLLSSVSVQ